MAAHHEPFKALGPIDWSDVAHDELKHFLTTTFSSAQTLVDSLPLPANAPPQSTGRARSQTESAILGDVGANRALSGREHARSDTTSAAAAAQLRKEWKEVKANPNPLGISVYKLSGKDGRGAWFARRSVHEGVPYDKFKLALEREFAETLKVGTSPATGNIRGIGAEKKVEHAVCDGVGMVEVYLLSAQFPGPTTPRDFVTLFLSSAMPDETMEERKKTRTAPRQFMVVSKPCVHPECATRSGFIRGQYESVEIIREIPVDKPLRRARSSVDMSREEMKAGLNSDTGVSKEAMLRSARKAALSTDGNHHARSHSLAQSVSLPPREAEDEDTEMAIEWLMVTRSDPGGSVPRFMVEKGTPNGIVTDADKLLKWIASKPISHFDDNEDNNFKEEAMKTDETLASSTTITQESKPDVARRPPPQTRNTEPPPAPSGFYNMIAGALGAAGSVVASRLPAVAVSFAGSAIGTDSELNDSNDSDSITSSEASFASAIEPEATPVAEKQPEDPTTEEGASVHSTESLRPNSTHSSQHEKQLQKLKERRKKLEEKLSKQQEKNKSRQTEDSATALAKLKEKHDREIQKQEESYQREVKKLEEKRLREERKAEEKRRKEVERRERNNVALELERVKVERDMYSKEIDILKDQVGELQSQNTKLVAQLGKAGLLGKATILNGDNGGPSE